MKRTIGSIAKTYSWKQLEEDVFSHWKRTHAYEYVKRRRARSPRFYFLDGPPFPSSDTPHIGTCWNKIVKDVILRYRRARGFDCRDQPGYDCHGLPIELAVERQHDFKQKRDVQAYGLRKFVSECKKFAEDNSEAMSRVFSDLGVWMDWKHPYRTHDNAYIESAWWTVKKSAQDGLLEHGLKVVHWCPRCETVLSDYEVVLEYRELRDPSIYVKFPIQGRENEYVLIWTTTPWTLPSNTGVMVHPDYEYARVSHDNEVYVMARERMENVATETGADLKVLETFKGVAINGLRYNSPIADIVPAQSRLVNGHRVVLSTEHVTLEEGTGCVHTAPGHGEEDYEVGMKTGLPTLMLVDNQGKFVVDAGKYAGKDVKTANSEVIQDLKERGALLFAGEIVHRSPVCWRCHTPLIIRATDQWFIRVTQMRDKMLADIEATKWIPDWAGASQFRNWLQGLRDWVISRQRFWGTPLPIWVCSSCSRREIIGSLNELRKRTKAKTPKELHLPWVDKVKLDCLCGGQMIRIPDVMVGWFDSGISSYACLSYPRNRSEADKWWPADFIVEGRDQISGWFFSLLKAGLIAFGETPYKTVLMHGFMLDEQGREMHKSLGNFVVPQEVIDRYGRDALRFYVLQNTPWEDLKFSWKILAQVAGDLQTIWNVFVFASTYMKLDRFEPAAHPPEKMRRHMREEDLWLMSRTEHTVGSVTAAMEGYRIHEAVRALRSFLVEDLSHNYVRLVRRRTWVEKEDPDKLAGYSVLSYALKRAAIMMAPFAPFTAEALYQGMFRSAETKPSVTIHALDWPEAETMWVDEGLEKRIGICQRVISATAMARMKAGIKLRQPVRAVTVATDNSEIRDELLHMKPLLLDQLNTRSIELSTSSNLGRSVTVKAIPNMTVLGPELKSRAGKVAEMLHAMNPQDLRDKLSNGQVTLDVDSEKILIESRHVSFVEETEDAQPAADFDGGRVSVDTVFSHEETADGLARDLVRRIQQMRKEMDLKVDAFIDVHIVSSTADAASTASTRRNYISSEVRAKRLTIEHADGARARGDLAREWSIGDDQFSIGLTKRNVTRSSLHSGKPRRKKHQTR